MKRFTAPFRMAILTMAFGASAAISAEPQPISAHAANLEKAVALAKQRNMPLMVVGHSDT